MIEEIIIDYLKNALSVPVGLEPTAGASEYVVIEKTGSSVNDRIFSATIAVRSVSRSSTGGSLFRAAELNENVKLAMEGIIENDDIVSCKLNTDYNFTDTNTKSYRYQAVYDFVHY